MKVFLTAGKEWRAPYPTTSLSQPSRSPSPPHHTYGEIHSPHTPDHDTTPYDIPVCLMQPISILETLQKVRTTLLFRTQLLFSDVALNNLRFVMAYHNSVI